MTRRLLPLLLRIPGVTYADYRFTGHNSRAWRMYRLSLGLASIADGLVGIASAVLPVDSSYEFDHCFQSSSGRPFMRFGARPED